MVSKIWLWINDRMPLKMMLQTGLDEEIPGGASFFYTLGSATLFVFALQIITGIWQLFYYVPTVDNAYNSLSYLRIFVPFGWLIHGLHYWGGNAMVVLLVLHMVRVFVWGAYKKPRELTWLLGVFLLLLVIGLSFTGAALPWDERGYWAAEVGTSIASTIPFIGSSLESLLRGGNFMGQLTLSRFFILHTAIIPGIAIIIIVAHLIAFRNSGSVGPWSNKKKKASGNFWPDQIALDIIVASLILLILIALSAFSPPPFTGPSDPLDTSFIPKPEWNFLFLYETLKFFPGSLEIIGTMGIPTLIILLIIFVPFFDRKKDRNPLKRPAIMAGGFVFIAFISILTIVGLKSKPAGNQSPPKIVKTKKEIKLSLSAISGKKIFEANGCISCHSISGKGGKIGPELTNEWQRGRSKKWIIRQLRNSKKNYPNSIMPLYTMLSTKQLDDLTDFLLSRHAPNTVLPVNPSRNADTLLMKKLNKINKSTSNKVSINQIIGTDGKKLGPPGPAAGMIGNIAHGALLFERNCESCHGINGKGGISNPGSLLGEVPPLNPIAGKLYSDNPQTFANNVDRIIQHGSTSPGTPALKMFDFGDSRALTQREITHLEAYILNLNGVNRAQIETTSFSPKQYFIVTAIIFLIVSILLFFINLYKKKKNNSFIE
ncbi:MAG TPA: c-type cytochrome [Ignavibacteria bacterium]|nr:c-type cytochrome [Ignavibacteria bacterium]